MKGEQTVDHWRQLRATSGFLATVGPIEWKDESGGLEMRFQVDEIHCNPVGSCHGGMLTTFADIVLGFGIGHAVGNGAFMPTIGLTVEFLAPVPKGSWVSGQAEILRLGRSVGSARCRITSDVTGLVMHASGIFKLNRPVAGDFSHSDYLSRT